MRSKRVWLAAAVASLVLGTGVVARAVNPAVDGGSAAATGLEGWIEGIAGDPVVDGTIAVAGWAADRAKGTPVYRVEIFLDGKPVGFATVGVPRPDVAQAMSRPDYGKAGWNHVLDLRGVAPGRHRISAIAQDAEGEKQSLHGDKTIVVKSSPAPIP